MFAKLKKIFKKLGPGFITGASDDDPSGIATYSQTGAKFGYGQLWLIPFCYPIYGGDPGNVRTDWHGHRQGTLWCFAQALSKMGGLSGDNITGHRKHGEYWCRFGCDGRVGPDAGRFAVCFLDDTYGSDDSCPGDLRIQYKVLCKNIDVPDFYPVRIFHHCTDHQTGLGLDSEKYSHTADYDFERLYF